MTYGMHACMHGGGGGGTCCRQVLQYLGFDGCRRGLLDPLTAQARILAFYYLAAYSLLKARRQRYQPLLPPAEAPRAVSG